MYRVAFLLLVGMAVLPSVANGQTEKVKEKKAQELMAPKEFLKWAEGDWEGEVKTWFQPGQLVDKSQVKGTFKRVYGGRFLRHEYVGSMKGKKRLVRKPSFLIRPKENTR